jgi:hypothetical protein
LEAARDAAIDRVMNQQHLFQKQRGLPGGIEYIDFGEAYMGALVDFQDDEDHELTEYVADEAALDALESPVQDGLAGILSSGGGSLDHLLAVAGSGDWRLRVHASLGILRHPDASREQIADAVRRMARCHSHQAIQRLEESSDVWPRLRGEDLIPLFTADESEIRERAMRLMGKVAEAAVRTQAAPGTAAGLPEDETPHRSGSTRGRR